MNRIKYSFILTAVLILVSLSQIQAFASPDINVVINGTNVIFTQKSGEPFIDSANRTQVPLRVTMESFGCNVNWDNVNRIAIVEKDGISVKIPIGQGYIFVNGNKVTNDTAAQIKSNKTYLPIRAVLEAFGAGVKWDIRSNSVIVTDKGLITTLYFDTIPDKLQIPIVKIYNKFYYIASESPLTLNLYNYKDVTYGGAWDLTSVNLLINLLNENYNITDNNFGNNNVEGSITIDYKKIYEENYKISNKSEFDGVVEQTYRTDTITLVNGEKISITTTRKDPIGSETVWETVISTEPSNICVSLPYKANTTNGLRSFIDLNMACQLAGVDSNINIYYDYNMNCEVLDLDSK